MEFNQAEGFPCTHCGICCKHITNFDMGNGICKHLNLQSNECEIYENRPDICRVDVIFEKVYRKFFSKSEFYALNISACEALQAINKFN
ncbi:YkgJ family cysteine cluster protein [Helicobacter sp. UBA3407]|uniref:YkgJ family cysteine cluster protein n=1 Tax=Helicobacter sp. UBA3407 TaxID=1946588 RepID=UPI00260C8742|nr:YkgJ family cysteine cluster protein [Helicobacter sp. UBA3407]